MTTDLTSFEPEEEAILEPPVSPRRGPSQIGPPSQRARGIPAHLELTGERRERTRFGEERFPGELGGLVEIERLEEELKRRFERDISPPGPGFIKTAGQAILGAAGLYSQQLLMASTLRLSQADLIDKQVQNIVTEQAEQDLLTEVNNFTEIQRNYFSDQTRLQWRRSVIEILAGGQGRTIGNLADLHRGLTPPLAIQPADLEWAESFIAGIRVRQPAIAAVSPEEQEEIQEERWVEARALYMKHISERRSISAYGLAAASGMSMSAYLKRISSAQLREGDVIEDLQEILRKALWTEQMIEELLSESNVSDLEQTNINFEHYMAMIAILQDDLREKTPEDLERMIREGTLKTIIEKGAVGLAFMQPILYFTRLLEQGSAVINIPWLAATGVGTVVAAPLAMQMVPAKKVVGNRKQLYTEFMEAYSKERTSGAGFWEALDFAQINSTMSGWEKFAQVILLDPFTYVGWGVYAKTLRLLPRYGGALGGAVEGIEKGYLRVVDKVALDIAKWTAAKGGKTVRMLINEEVRESISNIFAAMGKVTGQRPLQVAPRIMRLAMLKAVDDVIAHPDIHGEIYDAARSLLRRAPITRERALETLRRIDLSGKYGVEIDPLILNSNDTYLALDDAFQRTVGLGSAGPWQMEEASKWIAMRLGVEASEEALKRIRTEIEFYHTLVKNTAKGIMHPQATVPKMIQNMMDHLEDVITQTRRSELVTLRARQSSLGVWLKQAGPATLLTVQTALDWVSRGVSRQYLLFTAYGVGNIVEVMMKSFLSGVSIPWGRWGAKFGGYEWRNVAAARLQTVSLNLTGLNEKFMFQEPSNLSQKIGRDADALSHPGRISANKLKRSWEQAHLDFAKKLNPLSREGYLQETFVVKPSRIGLALEANYITQRMLIEMEELAGPILFRARAIVNEEIGETLSKYLGPNEVKRVIAEFSERSYVGVEQLLLDLPEDFTLAVVDLQHVEALLTKAQTLSLDIHRMLSEAAFDGSLFANLDGVFAKIEAQALMEIIESPQLMRNRFIELADEFVRSMPDVITPRVITSRLKIINDTMEQYQTHIGIQFHQVNNSMSVFAERASRRVYLDQGWEVHMGPLMDSAEAQVNRMVDVLRPVIQQRAGALGFTLKKAQAMEEILDANLEVIKAIRVVRTAQTEAEEAVRIKFGGKVLRNDERFDDFVDEMFEARNRVWIEGLNDIHDSWYKVEGLAETISEATLPTLYPIMTGPSRAALTPMDIASLFESHPHDLIRGLYIPERGLFRTKAEFVSRVMGRARAVTSNQGIDILDTTYTNEAVERIYDQIVSHAIPDPLWNEIKAVKAELIKYGQQRGALMAPEAHDELVKSADNILRRLKEDPQTSLMFLDEAEEVEILTQLDHAMASEVIDHIDNLRPVEKFKDQPRQVAAHVPKNPKRLDAEENILIRKGLQGSAEEKNQLEAMIERLKDEGYDGIIETTGPLRFEAGEAAGGEAGEMAAFETVHGFQGVNAAERHVGESWSTFEWRRTINDRADLILESIRTVGGDEAVQLEALIDEAMTLIPSTPIEDMVLRDLTEAGWNYVELPTGGLTSLQGQIPLVEEAVRLPGIPTTFRPTAAEWNALLREKVTFDYLLGHWSSFNIQLGKDYPLRDIIGKLTKLPSMQPYRDRLRSALVSIYGDEVTVFRGVKAGGETRMGGEEITETISTTSLPEEGFNFGRRRRPEGFTDVGRIKVDDILAVGNVKESELIVDSALFRTWSEVTSQGTRRGRSWRRDIRQPAFDKAKDSFRLDFPNYDDETIFNSIMRTIFPFWTYEAHRWPWLARELFRHPGTVMNWGRYMDNTELGYVSLPSNAPFGLADLQVNLLRGSIWMGGMRRLLLQDFPEYYDNFPGVANAFDWASRLGFYPNVWISGALAIFGPKIGPMQLGELLPPTLTTPLDMYIAANPESQIAQRLTRMIFNNRFRDYMTAQYVSKSGANGFEILRSIRLGNPLTIEEEQLWASGNRQTAVLSMFMTQTPFFRLRPQERLQFQRDAKKLIAEATGISVATQDRMRKAGLWLEDYLPLHPQHAQLLRELDGWARWGGLTQHLRETLTGQAQARISMFWYENQKHRDINLRAQNVWDRRLAMTWLGQTDPDGQVDIGVWEFHRRDLGEDNRRFKDSLLELDAFKWTNPKTGKKESIPITLEERSITAQLLGYDPPIQHAVEEAQAILFSRDIEDFIGPDPDTGNLVANWGDFYAWQDTVLESMNPDLRQELEAWLSRNMTVTEKLRKSDWKLWVSPYRATRNVAMAEFEADEQIIIKRFMQSKDTAEITRLKEVERADGTKLISQYNSSLREMRTNLRKVDYELDARLSIWGEVTSFQTEAAERRFEELKYEYAQVILNN